jgi:hypothetical protein
MGKVDQILFLFRQGRDILIVQVYVDDIVFGGSSNSLVIRFAEDMSWEFEMSMMALHEKLALVTGVDRLW